MSGQINELWLIWRGPTKENRRRYRVGTLKWSNDEGEYTFEYDSDFKLARENGFVGYPGFDDFSEGHVYRSGSADLFHNISARVPKPKRDDYLDILNKHNLDPTASEYDILIATRGRQLTDNFEFVPAFSKDKIEFEVSGVGYRDEEKIRRYWDRGLLREDAKIILEPDPDNQNDKNAIKIIFPVQEEEVFIGYVPRYYSEDLTNILKAGVEYSAVISRIDLNTKNKDEKISAKIRLIFAQK